MMVTTEVQLLILSILLIVSILASKISDRVGVPALLLLLFIGMLAGSDGIGGIYFDNASLAQGIGVLALVVILFSGGLSTDFRTTRPVLMAGLSLALLGVLLTAFIVGLAAYLLLDFTLLEGLLLGAIVSSTDAAAVFSVLRARGVSLKGHLKPLLEFESGSNDPMAVFLTLALIKLLTDPSLTPVQLIPLFFVQMGLGALVGLVVGQVSCRLINRINLGYEGLYPVLALTVALFTYGLAGAMGGSGFMAVYLAGLTLGNKEFIHRRSLLRFFDGMAWLMQITMFLALGLLVFPSRLPAVAFPGLLIALVLMLFARPLGVFISLLLARLNLAEKTFVAWIGLRGAAPIVLATFPLLAGLPQADMLFNLVFFVVLTSVLLQGPSIPFVARLFGVDSPHKIRPGLPIEPGESGYHRQLRELVIQPTSPFAGARIVDLHLPDEFLVVLIDREDDYIIPSGGTEIQTGDKLIVISGEQEFQQVQQQAGLD